MSYSKSTHIRFFVVFLIILFVFPISLVNAANPLSLTLVSGPSPFANCTAGSGPGAVNFTNAEVEPYVAINPANSKNIIGVWQQDRWNDGGSHGLVAGFSSNGGKTWSVTPQPLSICAPGGLAYERASDPLISIGPAGTAYSISI